MDTRDGRNGPGLMSSGQNGVRSESAICTYGFPAGHNLPPYRHLALASPQCAISLSDCRDQHSDRVPSCHARQERKQGINSPVSFAFETKPPSDRL